MKLGYLATVSALLMIASSNAMAADIFTPISQGASKALTTTTSPTTISERFVTVNTDLLISEAVRSRTSKSVVNLNIEPGVNVPVVIDREDPSVNGMRAFAGRSPGDPASSATIVVDHNTVYSVVQYNNTTWEISTKADGVHSIRKINQDKFPKEKYININEIRNQTRANTDSIMTTLDAAGARTVSDQRANTIIKVGIVATDLVRSKYGNGWFTRAQASITDANSSFANSGLAITFQLAAYGKLEGYNESGKTYDQLLTKISTSSETFRNNNRIDLIAFLRDPTGAGAAYCGLGNYVKTPSGSTKQYAYSVVNYDCSVGNHSYVHEAGHNMGLLHDRYVEGKIGTDQAGYNYGYSNVTYRVRTVMAYANYCNSQGVSCTRVGYFSNPFKTSNGGVLGVDVGRSNPAYNSKRLNETKTAISNYR